MAVNRLKRVNDFDSLLTYLRDELDWPVDDYGFDDLTFQYTATELGLDEQSAAKVTEIRRLRPLDDEQPWGIFFLELEPKRLPVVALRRLLSKMTLKKRDVSNRSDSPAWHADDILFISQTGESDERHLTFAHFAANPEKADLPVLKVLGWDASDTVLRVDHVAEVLKEKLVWPEDPSDSDQWRKQWRDAFSLRYREQVTTAKEMASRLAELARGIRGAIQNVLAVESENGPMTQIMNDFKKSLVHDLDPEQFADTYAQTITYGLLSTRITDPSKNTLDDLASHMRTNPFLKELMESFIHVGGRKKSEKGVGLDFDELGVSDVIDVLDNANMEAVVRDFGRNNQQEDPVIHFFEGFLQEYDSSIRKDRGVFYTPRPVVSFIVRSVDELLRTEFCLEDGLADTSTWGEMVARIDDLEIPEGATLDQAFVQILDPATGTGTFIVEVIDLIHRTMIAKWQAEGHGKKKIEALWNTYVPEHLLPRLYGYELMMAPYAIAHMKIGLKLYETGYRFESDERARVYLTNALEPAQDLSDTLDFAIGALAHEAEAVNAIKRDQRFTAVIGNPPYSVKSSNRGEWIRELLSDFKRDLSETKINLDDDFIKFIRLAANLTSISKTGLVGMITNNVFLTGVTHRQMRKHLLGQFSAARFCNLHGDSRYGEVPPPGKHNENVFDIQQGVSVSLLVMRSQDQARVEYVDVWGSRAEKTRYLLGQGDEGAVRLSPTGPLYLIAPPPEAEVAEYDDWPRLSDWMPIYSNGIETHKDALTIHFKKETLEEAMTLLLSNTPQASRQVLQVGDDGRDWKLQNAIESLRLMAAESKTPTRITYRPFDTRFTMLNRESGGFVAYPRWEVMSNMVEIPNNIALVSARLQVRGGSWDSCFVTRFPTEKKTGDSTRSSTLFPLLVSDDELFGDTAVSANFAPKIVQQLHRRLAYEVNHEEILFYVYAVLYSPKYRLRYCDQLKVDFPRIPLVFGPELFVELSLLGRQLVSFHLMESTQLNNHITVTLGSGEFKVEKISYSDETVWIDKAKTRGFKGVSEGVWNFHIGGYQVCQKWLKDRGPKKGNPGRVLTTEDIEHYQEIVVALRETVRIMTEIDEVIEAHGGWPHAFQMDDTSELAANGGIEDGADEVIAELTMVVEPRDG